MTGGKQLRVGDLVPTEEACGRYAPEDLVALIEGRLDDKRAAEISEHCSECPVCRGFLEENALFDRLVRASPASPEEARSLREAGAHSRTTAPSLSTGRSRPWWPVGIAAALAAVAAGIAIFTSLHTGSGPLPGRLPASITADLESIPLLPPPDVRGAQRRDPWADAAAAWNAGNLAAASRILEKAAAAEPDDAGLWFYIGLSRLRLGQSNSAVTALRLTAELEQPFPTDQTRWVLALALLEEGEQAEACTLLESLETTNAFADRARSLSESACR